MNYSFTTTWRLENDIEAIWKVLFNFQKWPQWWKGVEEAHFTNLKKGRQARLPVSEPAGQRLALSDRQGDGRQGSVLHLTWSTGWYRLSFNLEVTTVVPQEYIEAKATGDLQGVGRIMLFKENQKTIVQFKWDVQTQKTWMKLLGPIASPVFSYEHHKIMKQGEEGIVKLLKTREEPGSLQALD